MTDKNENLILEIGLLKQRIINLENQYTALNNDFLSLASLIKQNINPEQSIETKKENFIKYLNEIGKKRHTLP